MQIGGTRAPSPVGDLGFIEMTQALLLEDVTWQPSGPDIVMHGYLPQSGRLKAVAHLTTKASSGGVQESNANSTANGSNNTSSSNSHTTSQLDSGNRVEFYKSWDQYGCFSNFSSHNITMPDVPMTRDVLAEGSSDSNREWSSVEHYYQSQKFMGVNHPDAIALVEAIFNANSPEEAAKLGRRAQRTRPELMRSDWDQVKPVVMLAALRRKFEMHQGPRNMLLGTDNAPRASLVETSPHDYYWGEGHDGSGENTLGKLLMQVRDEMMAKQQPNTNKQLLSQV